jgi:RND family efflux transporter MFP subunit
LAVASDAVDLSFRNSGVVSVINISVGSEVKLGQVLAELDNVKAKLSLEQSLSALKAAESGKDTAFNNLERIKSLYENNGVSLSQYQASKNSYQGALSQYESAQKTHRLQQEIVADGLITAPRDGVIAAKKVEQGETVNAGTVVAVLNAGEGVNVEVGAPESVINSLKVGMAASLHFASLGEATQQGTISEVSPVIDPNSSTSTVTVSPARVDRRVRPGMAADVSFLLSRDGDGTEQLMAPIKAVGEDANGNFVYVIESSDGKTGKAVKRSIVIGDMLSGGFVVRRGLNEGERVATAGLQTLMNGQRVRLK